MDEFLKLLEEAPPLVSLEIRWGDGGFEITIVGPKSWTYEGGDITLTKTVWPSSRIDDTITELSITLLDQLLATKGVGNDKHDKR